MSKTLAVGMTSAARKEQYSAVSLASFRDAGFDQTMHVFAEPGAADLSTLDTDVETYWNNTQLGCFPNWKHSLTWLVKNVSADWYMIVQDDVIYRNDTWAQLEKGINCPKYQDVGFLSPYASAGMVSSGMRAKKGWWPAAHGPGKGFWGALTFCMPRQSAKLLLSNKRFRNHSHYRKVDVIVGNCFRDMNRDRMICLPSLCDHIGRVSTLGRHKIKGIAHGRRGYRFRESV